MTDDAELVADGIRLHRNLYVPTDSGTIATNRYEPLDADGPQPAIVIATPYRKDDRITFGSWDPSIRYFVRNGYEVVVMDLLGTGASTGTRAPFDGTEGTEVAAVIDWLADREWTTGRVGTYGLSYGAWTQYLAAAEQPDALGAIVPVSVVPSVYESSVSGGVFNLLKRAPWAAYMQALRALPPSYRDEDGEWAEVWHDRLDAMADEEPWLFRFLAHETDDEFWADRRVNPDEIDVPVLAACGYRDVHTGPMVEFVREIDAPTRLYLGPWRHTFPQKGRETAIDFRRRAVEWFDHHLRERETGALDQPPITYWTERNGGWTPEEGVWRSADRWPPTDERTAFALAPSGLVRDDEFDSGGVERRYEYDHTVGIESLDRIGSVVNEGVPTNADDARSLVFETDPLSRPYELSGTPTTSVRLRSTTADPVLAVRVLDVDENGVARSVSGGYLRASHRDGHADPQPLDPGAEYRIPIRLKPRSHVFERGHRIRIALSAGQFPRTLPTRGQGSFTVRSTPAEPSRIELPGTSHDEIAFDDTVSLSRPDDSIPVESRYVTDSDSGWATTRSHSENVGSIETWNSYALDLPHGPTFTWENEVDAAVRADDPTSAVLRYRIEVALDYGTERVAATTDARVSRAHASIATEVTVDGDSIFDERWRHRS